MEPRGSCDNRMKIFKSEQKLNVCISIHDVDDDDDVFEEEEARVKEITLAVMYINARSF